MNRFYSAVVRTVGWLLQLLHPRACVLCRRPLPTGSAAMLCGDCVPRVRQEYRNTLPVVIPDADGADAPLLYTGEAAAALRRYKFNRHTALCKWFSAQAAACLAGRLCQWQPDCLTYVPIGAVRWWSRGFNQSAAAARQIGSAMQLPVYATLGKRPLRGRQSGRSAAQRQRAAQNMFFALPGQTVRGKSVILVDDVITTGATASDAVRALREAGAARVYVLALARTPAKSRPPKWG